MQWNTAKNAGRNYEMKAANYIGVFIESIVGDEITVRITPVTGVADNAAPAAPAGLFATSGGSKRVSLYDSFDGRGGTHLARLGRQAWTTSTLPPSPAPLLPPTLAAPPRRPDSLAAGVRQLLHRHLVGDGRQHPAGVLGRTPPALTARSRRRRGRIHGVTAVARLAEWRRRDLAPPQGRGRRRLCAVCRLQTCTADRGTAAASTIVPSIALAKGFAPLLCDALISNARPDNWFLLFRRGLRLAQYPARCRHRTARGVRRAQPGSRRLRRRLRARVDIVAFIGPVMSAPLVEDARAERTSPPTIRSGPPSVFTVPAPPRIAAIQTS